MLDAPTKTAKPTKRTRLTQATDGLFGSEEVFISGGDSVIRFDKTCGAIYVDEKPFGKYRFHKDKIRTYVELFNPVCWTIVTGKDEAEIFIRRRMKSLTRL